MPPRRVSLGRLLPVHRSAAEAIVLAVPFKRLEMEVTVRPRPRRVAPVHLAIVAVRAISLLIAAIEAGRGRRARFIGGAGAIVAAPAVGAGRCRRGGERNERYEGNTQFRASA